MEIKIKPVSGCMNILLTVLTLGVYPLMGWLNERNWPRFVDEQGLTTRGGNKIPWNEFVKVTRVITKVAGTGPGVEHFELKHAKGRVVVAPYRLENGNQAFDYIWQRLPQQAKKQ